MCSKETSLTAAFKEKKEIRIRNGSSENGLFYTWYLLDVEPLGTNQDEARREAANPFWEKLCGGRLESRVQHRGGAYL